MRAQCTRDAEQATRTNVRNQHVGHLAFHFRSAIPASVLTTCGRASVFRGDGKTAFRIPVADAAGHQYVLSFQGKRIAGWLKHAVDVRGLRGDGLSVADVGVAIHTEEHTRRSHLAGKDSRLVAGGVRAGDSGYGYGDITGYSYRRLCEFGL